MRVVHKLIKFGVDEAYGTSLDCQGLLLKEQVVTFVVCICQFTS